jgi:hypothetical protein
MFTRRSFRISVISRTSWLSWGWSVPTGECRNSASIRPQPLPAKSFPSYRQLHIILRSDDISLEAESFVIKLTKIYRYNGNQPREDGSRCISRYVVSIRQWTVSDFFFNSRRGTLGTAATTGLVYQPRMIGEGDCGEIGGMKIGRGNRNLPQRHFVHHKSHMTRPGFEPGPPRWEASD